MTTNKLKTRISGHKSNVNKLDKLLELGYTNTDQAVIEVGNKTALVDHCVKHQHRFGLDLSKIIDRSFAASRLPMLECFHIHNTPHTVNYRTDVDNISAIYTGLLHTIATKSRSRIKTNAPPPPEPPPPLQPTASPTSSPAPLQQPLATISQNQRIYSQPIPIVNNSKQDRISPSLHTQN